MQLKAQQAKDWDERHAEHGMSQTSMAYSVEQERVRSTALAPTIAPPLCATQGPSGAGDKNMTMLAQSMPSDMCVAALAPPPHVCTNQQDIMLVGVTQPSSKFVHVVARLL